jgi:Domain of unknown function (DUF1772)
MRNSDSGRRFWAFVTSGPLTLLTVISLIVSWGLENAVYQWWFAAALATLLERIFTFWYFIPTAVRLMRMDALSNEEEATAMARGWSKLNYIRIALGLIGWLAALKALSLSS